MHIASIFVIGGFFRATMAQKNRVEQYIIYTIQIQYNTIRINTQYTKCLEDNTCIIIPPPGARSVVRRELYRVRSMAEPAVATAVRQPEAIQKGMHCTRLLEC